MDDKNLFHPLKVGRKIQETPDAVSLVLDIPAHLKDQYQYTPGQFVKVQVQVGGETLARSYSIASCPGWDDDFKITIKKVPQGRVSSFLVDTLQQNDSLLVRPPRGRFVLPANLQVPKKTLSDAVGDAHPTNTHEAKQSETREATQIEAQQGEAHEAAQIEAQQGKAHEAAQIETQQGKAHEAAQIEAQQGKAQKLIFVAAGSGITPIMSMLKQALLQGHPSVLLYANRDAQNIIYHKELNQILATPPHGAQFRLQHHFSSQQGRLTATQLKYFFYLHDPQHQAHYFFCGPVPLMKTALEILKPYVPRQHLHHESFGGGRRPPVTSRVETMGDAKFRARDNNQDADNTSENQRPPATSRADNVGNAQPRARDNASSAQASADTNQNTAKPQVYVGPGPHKPCASQLQIKLDGQDIKIQSQQGESILEALLREGFNAPYGCTEGNCMSCLGTLSQGQVHQMDMGILTDENIQQNECLTCQARPLSPQVQLHYDI